MNEVERFSQRIMSQYAESMTSQSQIVQQSESEFFYSEERKDVQMLKDCLWLNIILA